RFPGLAEQLQLQVGLYDAWPASANAETRLAPVGELSASVALRGASLGGFDSDYRSFKRLLRDIARERSAGTLLPLIVRRLAGRPRPARPPRAPAGVGAVGRGTGCPPSRPRRGARARPAGRPLAAGGGGPLHGGGDWSRPEGGARRVPLGVRKVGLIAARGQP